MDKMVGRFRKMAKYKLELEIEDLPDEPADALVILNNFLKIGNYTNNLVLVVNDFKKIEE